MLTVMAGYMGAAEIKERLGGKLSRQRISQLTASEGFPQPVIKLAMGSIWDADEIEDWITRHRPEDAEPPDA